MLAVQAGEPISVTVTLIDGVVVARSLFDNSMNYRSAVIFGVPEVLDGDANLQALNRMTDHYLPGRPGEVRPPSRRDLAATRVLQLPLDEASVKIRSGPPTEEEDEDPRIWAGVIPLRLVADPPIAHTDGSADTAVPDEQYAQLSCRRKTWPTWS